jgi:hypothetical protein
MPAGDFQSIESGLKLAYTKKAIEVLSNEDTPFRRALKKMVPSSNKPKGGIIQFGARVATPGNLAQTHDSGALVEPKDQLDLMFTLTPTIFTGSFKIGWKTRAIANDSATAYNGGELKRRTEDTIADLSKYIEQVYVGTVGNGVLATCNAAETGATITLQTPVGSNLLRVNRTVSIRQGTAATLDTVRDATSHGSRITALSTATPSIHSMTLSVAVVTTTVIGDGIIVVPSTTAFPLAGSGATISSVHTVAGARTGVMANGLRGLVSNAAVAGLALQGVLRSGNESVTDGQIRDNGGTLRNLTESILITAFNNQVRKTGKRATDIWTNTGQVEKYIEFVVPDRRVVATPGRAPRYGTGYDDDTLVHYAPGVSAKFNVSYDIIPRELYLLNWSTFFHYVAEDMDWWDAPMLKPVPGGGDTNYRASYVANIASIENIGCDAPAANTVIRDLRDPLVGDA